jgi:hypothetical protein
VGNSPAAMVESLPRLHTFYGCDYIGQADGNAYILRKRAPLIGKEWKKDIQFTEVKMLDAAFLKQLEDVKKP